MKIKMLSVYVDTLLIDWWFVVLNLNWVVNDLKLFTLLFVEIQETSSENLWQTK
jgi:hypothetical protein